MASLMLITFKRFMSYLLKTYVVYVGLEIVLSMAPLSWIPKVQNSMQIVQVDCHFLKEGRFPVLWPGHFIKRFPADKLVVTVLIVRKTGQ